MLYGIGVGPGDPELLTLKAKRILEEVPVVFTPVRAGKPSTALRIAEKNIPEGTEIILLEFPMIRVGENLEELERVWEQNAEKILEVLETRDAAFLVLGDPYLYSTYSYIVKYLKKKGVEVKTIPGIAAFQDIACSQDIELARDDESLIILPMLKDTERIREEIKNHENIVLMKVSTNPEGLKAILTDLGLEHHFTLVSNSGKESEFVSTDIEDLNSPLDYFSTVIIKK